MSVSRPLPKSALKKMFLKVLHETGGPMDYTGIVRIRIAKYFHISLLSEDEIAEGLRAVYELERDEYIMQDPTQLSDKFKVLTAKGERVVNQSLGDRRPPSIDIDQLLNREDLREKVRDEYLSEDYDIAIFKAFKLLEETVRNKAGQPSDVLGADLMSKAFNTRSGILKHPDAQTNAENDAFQILMRGAIMWFKNPSSHRTVGYDDTEEVAHILAFANLLLNMVDQCVTR